MGNTVYLDFMTNPHGFSYEKLSPTAQSYLKLSFVTGNTPIERLKQLNLQALNLYRAHNIDLATQLLQIAVCAQHQNGGAFVNSDYQTNIENLSVIGEAAGVFSAYRPGGSALKSTQVGAMRCAEKIANSKCSNTVSDVAIDCYEIHGCTTKTDIALFKKWQKKNSELCGILRDVEKIKAEIPKLKSDISNCRDYKTRDMLISALSLYRCCVYSGEHIGSYGSAIYNLDGNTIEENDEHINKILIYEDGNCSLSDPTPIPNCEQWSETVWAKQKKRD